MIEWKFNKNAEPVGGSDGFWYDITDGGYIKPGDVLEDLSQIKAVEDAINVLKQFEQALEANDLLNEF